MPSPVVTVIRLDVPVSLRLVDVFREDALTRAIVTLATKYGHCGYRQITALSRNAGWQVGYLKPNLFFLYIEFGLAEFLHDLAKRVADADQRQAARRRGQIPNAKRM